MFLVKLVYEKDDKWRKHQPSIYCGLDVQTYMRRRIFPKSFQGECAVFTGGEQSEGFHVKQKKGSVFDKCRRELGEDKKSILFPSFSLSWIVYFLHLDL